MIQTEIDMHKLFTKFDSQEKKIEFVRKTLMDDIMQARKNKGDFYLFDDSAIVEQRFQWQSNIQLTTTRKFDQFMIINSPDVSNKSCDAFIYINGPAFLKEFPKDGSR